MKTYFVHILLIFILALMLPVSAGAWTAPLYSQMILDAADFSPNRLRSLIKKQRDLLEFMAESAVDLPVDGKNPEMAMAQAVEALKKSRNDPEGAVRTLVETGRFLLAATRPTDSKPLLEKINLSTGCQQVEFDGIEYFDSLESRVVISRSATEISRKAVFAWAAGRQAELAAAEGVDIAYHVTVNDLADLFATLWKTATKDTANTASAQKRIWHGKSPKDGLYLPKGYDAVPQLAEYYRDLNSPFAQNRLKKTKTKSPIPTEFFLLKLKGLKIISKEGAQLKQMWEKDHVENEPAAPEQQPKEPAPGQGPLDIRDEPRPDLPLAAPAESQSLDKRETLPVHHEAMTAKKQQTGILDQESIEQTISARITAIRSCYHSTVADTGAVGTIAIMFTINLDGSVSDVEIAQNTINSQELADCLVALIQKTRFPAPKKDVVRIRYPFIFQ